MRERHFAPILVFNDAVTLVILAWHESGVGQLGLLQQMNESFDSACGHDAISCHANKKADVIERPKAFDHVGLLRNEPPGTAGLLFI